MWLLIAGSCDITLAFPRVSAAGICGRFGKPGERGSTLGGFSCACIRHRRREWGDRLPERIARKFGWVFLRRCIIPLSAHVEPLNSSTTILSLRLVCGPKDVLKLIMGSAVSP